MEIKKMKMSENHLLQKRTPEKICFQKLKVTGAEHIRENEFLNLMEPDLPNEHIAYDKIIVQ